jgi:hypothetical protein
VHTGDVRKYDALGRVRRPYLYAGDDWADIGNVAVQRHDNGGDPYEIVNFYTSTYEDSHLFDNHRRGRATFAARSAVNRALSRYNMKLMEYAKGFALLNEVYTGAGLRDSILDAAGPGAPFEANALSSSLAFDHFARLLTRPHPGAHVEIPQVGGDLRVLTSTDTVPAILGSGPVSIPEGTLLFASGDTSYGGRPLNNDLDDTKGYFATDYLSQVGSYYEKAYAAAMFSDSFDRFVPSDRDTFFDGRYRNIGMATLFPEGVRRLFANVLTEDSAILGWRAAGTLTGAGGVRISTDGKPTYNITQPMGQRTWWLTDPTVCWPRAGRIGCSSIADESYDGAPPPAASLPLDPEVGFEVQKFVIFWSLLFLPENWKQNWVDMMRVWVIGSDVNPTFPNDQSIAWRDPTSGQLYVAHSYGTEDIDERTVQRGIAARAIEWANTLTREAYEVEAEDDLTGELTLEVYPDDDDCPDGITHCTGQPMEKDHQLAIRLNNYKSVIDYLRDVSSTFGFGYPDRKGIY